MSAPLYITLLLYYMSVELYITVWKITCLERKEKKMAVEGLKRWVSGSSHHNFCVMHEPPQQPAPLNSPFMLTGGTANRSLSAVYVYSETSPIRHSMGPENNVGLGGCWIMECLLPYLCMVTDTDCTSYNGWIRENVGLERFHCMSDPVRWMV